MILVKSGGVFQVGGFGVYYVSIDMTRAILSTCSCKLMLEVIRNCISFALLRSLLTAEHSLHPYNQLDAKQLTTWSLPFSCV